MIPRAGRRGSGTGVGGVLVCGLTRSIIHKAQEDL